MKKLTNEEIIERIKKTTSYDTSETFYINSNIKIKLICHEKNQNGEEHGEFYVTVGHLNNGHGCPKCGLENRVKKRKKSLEQFIFDAKNIHGDKYDYSKVEYNNSHTKVCIICPKHGEFWQTPASHLNGRGCPHCSHPCFKYTTEDFIKKAEEVHGDKYDYSKVEYNNAHTKVCIICPKHGEFWQTASEHLNGCGCKFCKESHLELEIRIILTKNKIKFLYDVRNIEWLKPLALDFYLPDYNTVIECQGKQHFEPVEYFGGVNCFVDTIERDRKKKNLVINNGNKIIYIIEKCFKKNIKSNILLEEIYSNVPIVWVEIDKNGNLKNDDKQKLIETILNL